MPFPLPRIVNNIKAYSEAYVEFSKVIVLGGDVGEYSEVNIALCITAGAVNANPTSSITTNTKSAIVMSLYFITKS